MIAGKLEALARLAPDLPDWRSRPELGLGRSWRRGAWFGDRLNEAALARFERRIGVTLPGDYRAFLERIGHGGLGPAHGLMRIDEHAPDREIVRRSFPLRRSYWHDPSAGPKGRALIDLFRRMRGGTLRICAAGDAIYYVLVLRGPERGSIWCENLNDGGGFWPLLKQRAGVVDYLTGIASGGAGARFDAAFRAKERRARHATFDEWYGAWLDDLLRKLSR